MVTSEKIIRTLIPLCWLETLNEEVAPLLKGTEFFVDEVPGYTTFDGLKVLPFKYVAARIQLDDKDMKKEFLFALSGQKLEDVYEVNLRKFIEDRLGHKI